MRRGPPRAGSGPFVLRHRRVNADVTAVGAAGKGTATIDAPGSWQVDYEPSPDANGSDSFDYTVSDGHGGTDTGTMQVTITPVNDDPEAADDEVTVVGGASDVPLAVLDNDHDVDGDTLADALVNRAQRHPRPPTARVTAPSRWRTEP